MTSYARQAYQQSLGGIGQRVSAVQQQLQQQRIGETALEAQEDNLLDARMEAPVKEDETAMGIGIGASQGVHTLFDRAIAPRLVKAVRGRAEAKLRGMLADATEAARGRGMALVQDARGDLRNRFDNLSATAQAEVNARVRDQAANIRQMANDPNISPADLAEARRELYRRANAAVDDVSQRAGDAAGAAREAVAAAPEPEAVAAAAREAVAAAPEAAQAVAAAAPEAEAAPAAAAEAGAPDAVQGASQLSTRALTEAPAPWTRSVRSMLAEDPFSTPNNLEVGIGLRTAPEAVAERFAGARQAVGDAADALRAGASDAAQRVTTGVQNLVTAAQQHAGDLVSAVRARVANAAAPYQADLAGAADRQAASGQIITDDHLKAIGDRFGVDTAGLASKDVDLGLRATIGDEATGALASAVGGESSGMMGTALGMIAPALDVFSLGEGVAGLIKEQAADDKMSANLAQLQQAQAALRFAPEQAGIGTAVVMDQRTDRTGGQMNY